MPAIFVSMSALALRPWTVADLPALLRHANDPGIAANMTDSFPHPYTEEAGRRFLAMARDNDPARILCITADGEAVGSIGLHPQSDIHRRNAELGYWLAAPFRGRGIMPQAIRHMVAHAFAHFPIDRVFARPFGSNIASQRALEKAGFTLEARLAGTIVKNGRVEDELIYAVRRGNG